MSQFSIIETPLKGLKIVERKPIGDSRGFLARIFCGDQLKSAGWEKPIAQINQTVTKKTGTVRGMHFQNTPHTEMKLVSCLQGEIWDVAVDLRKNSTTFLHWYAEKLSAENCRALLIPEGFAHGFVALSEDAHFLYKTTDYWHPQSEQCLIWNDPILNIDWHLPEGVMPSVNVKDAQGKTWHECIKFK